MASHINVYTPLLSGRITKYPCSMFPPSRTLGRALPNSIKAVAEKRDNFDHLQKVTSRELQPNRVSQLAPGSWDRFPTPRTVQHMIDTTDRMMEDPTAYGRAWPSVSPSERDVYSRGRTPWAIKERKKDYKLRFDMPGMTKNDIKVWIEENMLVVKAVKNADEDIGGEGWPAKSYGKYSFRIALPENIEFARIEAEVKDGVLYITIPKASTTRKIIDIEVK